MCRGKEARVFKEHTSGRMDSGNGVFSALMNSMRSSKCRRLICHSVRRQRGGDARETCTSFSLSKPDPSLKSNTTLQSLSLRERTGVLSPVTSLNIGAGVRNSGGRGPERALYSFIQNAQNQTQRPKSAANKCNVSPRRPKPRHSFRHILSRWRVQSLAAKPSRLGCVGWQV